MPTLTIRAIEAASGALKDHRLSIEGSICDLIMQALPGASAIHVFLCSDGSYARAEIEADTDEAIPIRLAWDASGVFRISSGVRRVFMLPVDERYEPAVLLRPALDAQKLDLLFLIDGTTRFLVTPEDPRTPPFLTPLLDASLDAQLAENRPSITRAKAWEDYISRFTLFARKLRERYPDTRSGVIAFGDHSMEFIASAPDLVCRYALYPGGLEQRKLRLLSEEQLRERFVRLPPTSGGDFVDALADALQQCQTVGWRADARRILLVFGDSPGFALSYPPPRGADIQVRSCDVDTEAMRLHADHGVEIVTVYAGAPPHTRSYRLAEPEAYLEYAVEQYCRLASQRSLCWTSDSFRGDDAAEVLTSSPPILGRQGSYGTLLRVDVTAGGSGLPHF